MALIKSPASMIMFGDDTNGGRTLYKPSQGRLIWGQNFSNPPQLSGAALIDRATNPNGNFPYGRHNGGVVMAFSDGHVKWMQIDTLYSAPPTAASGSDVPYYNGF